MLYLIIPPVIIVVSIAILLFLFSRKMSEIPDFRLEKEGGADQAGKVLRQSFFSRLGQLALRFLEKITQKFKVFSLKFYNRSGKLLELIKEKKKSNDTAPLKEIEKEEVTVVKEEKGEGYEFDEFVKKISIRESDAKTDVSVLEAKEEKPMEPMISKEAVKPEFVSVPRSGLEEILINRIVVNPKDLDAFEELGDFYFEQKNFSDAKDSYKQVLRISPANRRVRIKMRKLERIMGR